MTHIMTNALTSAAAIAALRGHPRRAELELSFYLGTQTTSDSDASGYLPDGRPFDRNVGWDGKSFDSPIYYGGRAMWWTAEQSWASASRAPIPRPMPARPTEAQSASTGWSSPTGTTSSPPT